MSHRTVDKKDVKIFNGNTGIQMKALVMWMFLIVNFWKQSLCKCQRPKSFSFHHIKWHAVSVFQAKRILTRRRLKISTTTIWLHFYKVSQMNSLGPINCAGEVAQKFWLSFSFFSGNFVYYEKEYQPIKYLVTFFACSGGSPLCFYLIMASWICVILQVKTEFILNTCFYI